MQIKGTVLQARQELVAQHFGAEAWPRVLRSLAAADRPPAGLLLALLGATGLLAACGGQPAAPSPPNRAPVAVDDRADCAAGQAVTIAVLANDHDPDGDRLALVGVGAPRSGTARQVPGPAGAGAAATGQVGPDHVRYEPAPGFVGLDRFAYALGDGRGGAAVGWVQITVTAPSATNRPPLARPDQAIVERDRRVAIAVLANDEDPDGDELAVAAVTTPGHGQVRLTPDWLVVYTPAPGYVGPDACEYRVHDGHGGTDQAPLAILVVAPGLNRAPQARDDAASVTAGAALLIDVLANDSDPDGDSLTLAWVGSAAWGAAAAAQQLVSYTAALAPLGQDSFAYAVHDGHGHTDVALVTVTVLPRPNRPPVAVDDYYSLYQGSPLTAAPLGNDLDPDGDSLHLLAVGPASHGLTSVRSGLLVAYTPAPDFVGLDGFSYLVADTHGATDTAWVQVAIVALDCGDGPAVAAECQLGRYGACTCAAADPCGWSNDGWCDRYCLDAFSDHLDESADCNRAPTAILDTRAVYRGRRSYLAVVDNDLDPDGDPLAVVAVGPPSPAQGSTAALPRGAALYVASADYLGPLAFSYTVSDGRGGSAVGAVSLSVLDDGRDCGDSQAVADACDLLLYDRCTCAPADPCGWVGDGECDFSCALDFSLHLLDPADCACSNSAWVQECCDAGELTACTCAPADPCGWAGDGRCQRACAWYFPGAHFSDPDCP